MDAKRSRLLTDIAFTALLILLFITILFIAASPERFAINAVILCVVFAVMLITHFTSVTAGLVINMVLVFVFMTYLIYDTIANSAMHGIEIYLWAVLSPLLSAAVGLLGLSGHQFEKEYDEIAHAMTLYSTLDSETGLKTKNAYMNEFVIFQNLAKRYNMQVLLIVWGLRFDKQLTGMLSDDEFEELTFAISQATKETFRKEDVIYLFQKKPFLWGTVTLVTPGNADKMVARMHKKAESIDLREALGKRAPKVELRIGTMHDAKNNTNPEKMLEGAIVQMQYDV